MIWLWNSITIAREGVKEMKSKSREKYHKAQRTI